MQHSTLVNIQKEVRDIRKALNLCNEFFNPSDIYGGRNTHG